MAVEAQYLPTTIISIILCHAVMHMSREHMAHKVGVVERHGQKMLFVMLVTCAK